MLERDVEQIIVNHSSCSIFIRENPGKNRSSAPPCVSLEATEWGPVRIWVRIRPPHSFASRKRLLNGGGPSNETGITGAPCHSRCGTIETPPCSKALIAKHRRKFSALHRQWGRLHISEKIFSGT
jgi:hypothetical protein